MIKVIVFDFDGTIVDSNQLKYDAFFDIFPDDDTWQGIVKDVLEEFRERTRGFIVERVLLDYEAKTSSQIDGFKEQANLYVKKYGDAVESGATTAPEVVGAAEAIAELSGEYNLYINSMTPATPLRRIVKARGLSSYFKSIYGAPRSKVENLTEIFNSEKIVDSSSVLVVGDGESDKSAALEMGCVFIGIRNEFNALVADNFEVLDDLSYISEAIKALR